MNITQWSNVALMVALVWSPPGEPAAAFSREHQSAAGEKTTVLVLPKRRGSEARSELPPPLPPLTDVTPLTLDVTIEVQEATGHGSIFRRRVSRANDRVHVAEGDGREWLFERNSRDSRRVSGLFVDHGRHVIVVYDESDLRNTQGIRGWTDVLTLGFDPELLKRLQAGTTVRRIDGQPFVRYTALHDDVPVQEVWWSAAQALPTDVLTTGGGGSVRLRIEHARRGVDSTILQAPPTRFPTYRVIDFADYLERH